MNDFAEPGLPTISVTLRDGSIAALRPIQPDDRVLLTEGLSKMSVESRFNRFGTGVDHLTDAELDYLTNVDHVGHVAWGALIDGEPAGVSRYIRFSDFLCADIAVTVVDKYQGRGLGRVLFEALIASARANDIDELCFAVQPFNEAVRRMLAAVDADLDETGGLVQGRIRLASVPTTELDDQFVELLARFQTRG
ncbi:MAG: GNAT family N-acetyltransferase [Actinomycetota bacterium]|nr:GNAT family N-acetyltransferase [Actinomycetota bacterium]